MPNTDEVSTHHTTPRAWEPRPDPFSVITTRALWTDPHVSKEMLRYHLDPEIDSASRARTAIEATVTWTTAAFSIGHGSTILDLGCGPGLYTNRWAACGAEVTGVDFSTGSIAYARRTAERNGLRVEYVDADYLEWRSTRRFDLVTMINCDFSALAPAQRSVLLRSLGTWVAPGGAFLFDAHTLSYVRSRSPEERRIEHPEGGFWAAGPHTEVVETILYPEEGVSLDRYTIIESERTRTIWNWLQGYDPGSLAEALRPAGFVIDSAMGDMMGRRFDPAAHSFAVVARHASAT